DPPLPRFSFALRQDCYIGALWPQERGGGPSKSRSRAASCRETLRPDAVFPSRRLAMSKFREKAEAQTKQIIGQMLGDEQLVEEGQEQLRHADEGGGDRDSWHREQSGMPKQHPPRAGETDQGIVRDERAQEQPKDKERAQRVSRVDRGGDPPGKRA